MSHEARVGTAMIPSLRSTGSNNLELPTSLTYMPQPLPSARSACLVAAKQAALLIFSKGRGQMNGAEPPARYDLFI